MNKRTDSTAVREVFEQIFAGVAFAAVVAYVAVGTLAMCLAGTGVA